VVVSPDVGGVVRARALAKRLDDADLAIIDKRRPQPNEARVMNIIGEVEGRTCILVDDEVDLENAADYCAGNGVDIANHFYCYSFEPNHDWSEYFSQQAELREYFERCADKYEVRDHIRFETEVISARRCASARDRGPGMGVATSGGKLAGADTTVDCSCRIRSWMASRPKSRSTSRWVRISATATRIWRRP